VVTCTPQKYAQSTQLVERNPMAFSVFGFFKIFSRFFQDFFRKKPFPSLGE